VEVGVTLGEHLFLQYALCGQAGGDFIFVPKHVAEKLG
jgi:hypothetical protein